MAKANLELENLGDFDVVYEQDCAEFIGCDVVILHGWGAKKELMRGFVDSIKSLSSELKGAEENKSEKTRIFNVDLPGFGGSSQPQKPMGYKDYAQVIAAFMEQKQLNKPLIIAHSFGCKIAAELAACELASALILAGAAGIKQPKPLSVRAKIWLAKCLKWLKIGRFLRAKDASNLSAVMYESFKIAVNDDARASYFAVQARTLLLAGQSDTATPLASIKELEQNMANAELVEFCGDHFFFLKEENKPLINAKILKFLKLNKR